MLAGIIASPSAYDPKSSRRRARAPQPGPGKNVRTGLHHPRAVRRRDQAGAAGAERHRAAEARLQGPLLHLLAAPAAGRSLRRRESLLRRAEGEDDARPAPPGSGRRGGQLHPGRDPADRLGGRARQPQRRRQGDGRRPRLRNQTVQPGHRGAPPARLLDQAVHADHGAEGGDLARKRSTNPRRRYSTSASTGRKSSSSTTTRVPTSGPAPSSRDHLLGQLDLRAARAGGAEGQERPAANPLDRQHDSRDGLHGPDLDQPGDGAGRAERGRHAAGLGLRLLDHRQRRRPGQRHPGARLPATAPLPTPKSPTRTAT